MQINDTLGVLQAACLKRGIPLLEGCKYQRKDYVRMLAEDVIARGDWASTHEMTELSWGMKEMMKLESPMLCYPWHKLKPADQENILQDKNWAAEEKVDGVRCIVTYHYMEGFRFFTRMISREDYLPHEITDRIVLRFDDKWYKPSYFAGWLENVSFVMDTEIVINGKIDISNLTLGDVDGMNKTSLILFSGDAPFSIDLQKQSGGVELVLLDVLQLNWVDMKGKSRAERMTFVDGSLMPMLFGIDCRRVRMSNSTDIVDKQEFYTMMLECGEGVVYKNLEAAYISTESRSRGACVKRKAECVGEEFDAFIGGTVLEGGKVWGIKLYVCGLGDVQDKHVATARYLSADVKNQLVEVSPNGTEFLKEGILGKVVRAVGYEFKADLGMYKRVLVKWDNDVREDKQAMDCDGVDVFGECTKNPQ